MKKAILVILCLLLLAGCAQNTVTEATHAAEPRQYSPLTPMAETEAPAYVSRYEEVTEITLTDEGITVNGGEETEAVFTSHDILYYEDRDAYDSGNPYGEGEAHERHSAEEADAHTVVNITAPGAYRVTGKLSAGQIRIDLGSFAFDDEDAVVELILQDADITCTVAPTILFLNTYECDNRWSVDTARAQVDTSGAGAVLILEGENTVNGSHVAKIFRDTAEEKKLWKQDGAVYSYMSLNVFGPGTLNITADNEGLDSELHLTLNSGSIFIRADNDGINTNEDGVSVTTVNGGFLHITAGLGAEGDGIDSNGYLVINGGTVIASANPAADAGMDADLGIQIHGGTVVGLGSSMDGAGSQSTQPCLNLKFSQAQTGSLLILREDGQALFAYDPGTDGRQYTGAIVSCPYFAQGDVCRFYTGCTLTGTEAAGLYDIFSLTGFTGGTRMQYSGAMAMGPGTMEQMPEGFDPNAQMPEGFDPNTQTPPQGEDRRPEGNFPQQNQPSRPEGEMPPMQECQIPPVQEGQMPQTGNAPAAGESTADFTLTQIVSTFSGISPISQ